LTQPLWGKCKPRTAVQGSEAANGYLDMIRAVAGRGDKSGKPPAFMLALFIE
jgi:hypothetical protein